VSCQPKVLYPGRRRRRPFLLPGDRNEYPFSSKPPQKAQNRVEIGCE
jgi:hypothetical protein